MLSKRQKETILKRLMFRGRRASSADTPPRSLSPEKNQPSNALLNASEYVESFPPSRREALAEVMEKLSNSQQEKFGKTLDFDEATFAKSMMAFEDDYRKCDENKYTPTGFSVEEVKALGDFPDYATLSGVDLPEAYKEFDITKAQPRPYRPFRWAYHQTMSLTKLETDWWLELESNYISRIAQRKALYAEHGESVLQWLPGSELACKEIMEMSLQFLCARYPQYFSLSADNKTFSNKLLDIKTSVRDKHPLLVMLDHIPEDFAIMLRNPETGYYHLRAGVICSALGWNVGTKIGMQLHQIHAPIPDYKEKMQFSMDRYVSSCQHFQSEFHTLTHTSRFFTKMPTFKPIQRGSWGLEVDQPLYMPPGDPHEKYRDFQAPELTLDRIHLRVDWQTLRRLPLSAGIVFNFKALFTPVAEFRDEAFIPALVLKVLNDGKENLMKYKNTWHIEHVVKPRLEEWKAEQERDGVVPKNWVEHTLDESPWFPGWEEKWRRQQGF